MPIHVTPRRGAARLRPEVEAELLRIAQEAINNARKHAAGHNSGCTAWSTPPDAEITVADDGVGLRRPRDDSHGLQIMRERAEPHRRHARHRRDADRGPAVTVGLPEPARPTTAATDALTRRESTA